MVTRGCSSSIVNQMLLERFPALGQCLATDVVESYEVSQSIYKRAGITESFKAGLATAIRSGRYNEVHCIRSTIRLFNQYFIQQWQE